MMFKYIIGLAALGLALQACKKDPVRQPVDDNPAPAHQIQINFSDKSININQIDSVVILLKKPGSANITQKLTKGDGLYYADNLALNNLEWSANINVYTTKAAGIQASHVYSINRMVTQKLALAAPIGKLTDLWDARLMVNDPVEKVQLIVAERPDDPFFALRAAKPGDWIYAYLERGTETATGQTETVKVWEAYDYGTEQTIFPNNQDHYNNSYFLSYANSMVGKPYVKGFALLMLFNKDTPNHDVTIYHVYDKRP